MTSDRSLPPQRPAEEYAPVTGRRIALVVAEWNSEVTGALEKGCLEELGRLGWEMGTHVSVHRVPGSFELTIGAKWLCERPEVAAVICLGCVIEGQTRHFEFICSAVAQGLTNLSLVSGKPVVFGVLTTQTEEQAIARAGGGHSHKGIDSARTAADLLLMRHLMTSQDRPTIGFSR